MKRVILCLCVLSIVAYELVSAETTPIDVVTKFFEASKDGNIMIMRSLITGPFLNKRKVLLEQNPGYPDFLREHYEGTQIQVMSIDIDNYNEVAVIVVRRQSLRGSTLCTKMFLRKDSNDAWRIFDETLAE